MIPISMLQVCFFFFNLFLHSLSCFYIICKYTAFEFQYLITCYLKGFKNIYLHPSSPVLLQILVTWPLLFFIHRNTWLLFHYELTGSATTVPARSTKVFTSSPSLLNCPSGFLSPVSLSDFDAQIQVFIFFNKFKISSVTELEKGRA